MIELSQLRLKKKKSPDEFDNEMKKEYLVNLKIKEYILFNMINREKKFFKSAVYQGPVEQGLTYI